MVICGPLLITCQSRGETYHGQVARSDGYDARSQQYQSPEYQYNPDSQYYQPQVQPQSYPNLPYNSPITGPEYFAPPLYSQPNSQSSFVQTSSYIQQTPQSYNRQPTYSKPIPVVPILSRRPPPPPLTSPNLQTQSKPLESRFGAEQSTLQAEESFTPRATSKPKGPKKPLVIARPPTFPSRFDERDSVAFTKKLTFNQQLSEAMEKFALELLTHMNLRLENVNFMISPFSIYHLMVLIAEGAGGNTFDEINNKLHLHNMSSTRDFQQYLQVALK